MSRIAKVGSAILIVQGLAVIPAFAQAPPPLAPQASIAINGGLSAASQANGATIGARLAFDLTDRFAIEADGSFIGRGGGADALSANVSLLVNLVSHAEKTVPYVAVGGGFYRASFDLDHDRFFGRLSGHYAAGTQMVPLAGSHGFGMMQGPYSGSPVWTGSWPGETYGPEHMPGFYVDRLGPMTVPADGRWGMRSFTDPALSLGGGIRLDVNSRLHVRPDARVLIVMANGSTHPVGVISLGIGYRF